MKNLRIMPSGNVLLTNEMNENHFKLMEKYKMSNYLDFTSGNLIDKKFNFSCKNQKVRYRDTFLLSSKTMGLDPFTNSNYCNLKEIDLSEYLQLGLPTELKLTVSYKLKINRRLTNQNNANIGFGVCVLNEDASNVNWYRIGVIGRLNDLDDIVEDIYSGTVPLNGTFDRVIPWFQVDEASASCDVDIDILYANYELSTDISAETHRNKLVYYAQGIRISQSGSEDTNNYDIKNLQIVLEDGSVLTANAIKSCRFNGADCTIPIGNNTLSLNGQGNIEIEFNEKQNIINVTFDHNELKHYHEKVILTYRDLSNFYVVYDSFARGSLTGVKQVFDYYSTTHVDLELQTRSFTMDGLQFTNTGDQLTTYRDLTFHNANIEICGNDRNLNERFIMRFKPVGNNQCYIKSNNVGTSGVGGDYRVSAWVRVSEDCDTDARIYLGFKNANDPSQNLSINWYDMNRKGEWQLLFGYLARSEVAPTIYTWIPLSTNRWTKGIIEVANNYAMTYTRTGDKNPQKIFIQNNSILSLNSSIVTNKSIYIECIPNILNNSSNPALIAFGDKSGGMLEIVQTQDSKINVLSNGNKISEKPIINNELLKMIINKNGNIYINGEKVATVSLPSTINFCNMGYNMQRGYGNGTAHFSGTIKRIISFRDEITDKDCKDITKPLCISLPIDNINEYNEQPNRPIENYKRYYFPLKDNLYDITGDILLPSTGNENNILKGIGYNTGSSSNNKINNTQYFHEGDKNPETNITIIGCTTNYGTISGFYEVLDPENLSEDDYVGFRYNDQIPNINKSFKLKGHNYFKVSEYNLTQQSSYRLYIKSNAKIIFYDLKYVEGGALLDNINSNAIRIKLQDLININYDFTIIYDIMHTMGHDNSNGYMISSLGYNGSSNDYFWFGKNNQNTNFSTGGYMTYTVLKSIGELTNYDWINDNIFRVLLTHKKSEKRIYLKFVNYKDQRVYNYGYIAYTSDSLNFTYNDPNDYTFTLGGWGDNGGCGRCNSIISNLHVIQKSLSDEELAKYLSPLSVGKDSLRAGLEFSELNNI